MTKFLLCVLESGLDPDVLYTDERGVLHVRGCCRDTATSICRCEAYINKPSDYIRYVNISTSV